MEQITRAQQPMKAPILKAVSRLAVADSERSAILSQASMLLAGAERRNLFGNPETWQGKAARLVDELGLTREHLPGVLSAKREIDVRIENEIKDWFKQNPNAFRQEGPLFDYLVA